MMATAPHTHPRPLTPEEEDEAVQAAADEVRALVTQDADADWSVDQLLGIVSDDWHAEVLAQYTLEHLRDLQRLTRNIKANRAVHNDQVADALTVQQTAVMAALNSIRRDYPKVFKLAGELALDEVAQVQAAREARRSQRARA
jgi:hypothetical protein